MKKSNLPTWKKLSRRWRRKHKLAAKHPQPPCLASFSPSFLHITIPQAQAAAAYTQKAAPEILSHYYSGKSWPLRSNPFNMSEWKVSNANAIWSKKLSSQPLKREERRAEKACACSLSAPAIIIFAAEAAFSIIAGLKSSITSATTTGGRMMDVMQMRVRENLRIKYLLQKCDERA